jgi:hypothetical protein
MTDFESRAAAVRRSPKARAAAWRKGQLWWLLHPIQFQMYQQFYASKADQVWNCARRLGKTYLLLVLMFECCLRKRRARAALGASQAVDVEDIIEPIVEGLLEFAPADVRPVPQWGKHRIYFPSTKAVLKIAGCDNGNYKHLRGRGLDVWALDEAAFIDELPRVADAVLSPQTWTTNGRGLMASSPPETPGHPFQRYYLAAKATGNSARYVFDDNPMLSPERRQEILEKEAAAKRMTVEEFKATTVYRREFGAEFVIEETRAVLPRLSESLAEALLREEESTPLFADWYTLIDLGGSRDPTGISVGYYDFRRQKSRLQRNLKLIRPTTEEIAKETRRLETETFAQMPQLRGMHFRIMDDDLGIVRRDLADKYNFVTIAPRKDDKQAGLMDLQDALLRSDIEFSPECRETLAQCQAAIWNKHHTEYERVDGFGHFDLLDCLLYMHRNVIPNKGRVPHLYGVDLQNTIPARNQEGDVSKTGRALLRAFGGVG